MKKINPYSIPDNVFSLIDKDWMLITAGEENKFNTMTASWGGFGILWNEAVTYIFVRPTRYTYQFINENDYYTLCFFEHKYRKILNYCGSHSGRDSDKIKATGLVPLKTPMNNVYFEQARLFIECRKIYFQDLDPASFLDLNIAVQYPEKDYHRMYIGKIVNCFMKD
jgi:flavin reductase (DIM6/NTAB) family NADH-FMN oxidoreductase RutF